MSFTRALPTLRQSTRALARPLSLKSVPHSSAPSILFRSSVSTVRPFSSTLAQWRYSPVADDPKWKKGEVVTYDELKPITQSPDNKILVIDVREPSEVVLGNIPSSVNLPMSTFEKALSMDEGDFTRVHGFHKPTKQQPMIFYCRAGIRGNTAMDLAKRAGYKLVRNYEGSYLDWEKHEAGANNQDD
ncbi:uncharacterized protein JCM6883_006651 [Sporobolomyces salmoneus]|uniref:uncharacterized protein n=1 Tax=Sporobolomyces salmoneus TaxID=183962 RepID=UPI0031822F06